MSFVTVEDVNGTQFDNQNFWWYEFNTRTIDSDGWGVFDNIKVDFLTISKEKYYNGGYYGWKYTITVNNSLFTRGFYVSRGQYSTLAINGNKITVISDLRPSEENDFISFKVYMGHLNISSTGMKGYLIRNEVNLNLKTLSQPYSILYYGYEGEKQIDVMLNKGYNEILIDDMGGHYSVGYFLVNLLKTDFQFICNQDLIVGEVNTVQLGTLADYKPNGDFVGEYATKLSVIYNGETLPVTWNETLNDYTFDLDLTDKTTEGKIRFKVIVETNDVLNYSETDVVLNANFETIDTLAKLTELFRIGGTGRLSSDLTLTNDLILSKSVNLIGNECSIDMTSHKISVGSDLTFKAQSVGFSNGVNSIQQEPNSTVEITDCSFTNCTGFGSVIDCQVDLASLDESDDFNTKLTNCTIANCDMAILHGGNLEVTGCTVTGKISNKNYPFFLYQTDGNATILNSQFNLTDITVYDYDIEFNSCIFTCGETATINGYSHTELQNNNLSAFFETQRNTSIIDVKYYYSLIEDTVHLQSNKGFCHSVSGVDYIFKSNVTITRGE